MSDPFATSAGAYVLGALGAEERHAFEQHLHECAECRAEVHRLAGLPGLLSRVPLRDVLDDDDPGPPDTLLPALLDRVRRKRRTRRTVLLSGSLALAACLVAVLAVFLAPGSGPAPVPRATPEAFAMTKMVPSPLDATARVADAPGGSKIDLSCVYRITTHTDWADRRAYTLAVVDRRGETYRMATWRIAGGETSFSSAVSVTRRDIAMIEVRDTHDHVLLRLRWPPPSPGTTPS